MGLYAQRVNLETSLFIIQNEDITQSLMFESF